MGANTDQRKRPYLWDRGKAARPVGWDRAVVASSGTVVGGNAKRSPEIHLSPPRSFTGAKVRETGRAKRHAGMADAMREHIALLAGTPIPTSAANKPKGKKGRK